MGQRWLIDGMNVIGSRPDRWWNDPDAAMARLVEWLDQYAEKTGSAITVVFDSKPAVGLHSETIDIVFASWKGRNAADHEIEVIVEADPTPHDLRVVTSDKRLAEKVRHLGAKVIGSGQFRTRMETAIAS